MDKEVKINDKLLNDTLAYLQSCPHNEVVGILSRWQALIEAPVKPKKPD